MLLVIRGYVLMCAVGVGVAGVAGVAGGARVAGGAGGEYWEVRTRGGAVRGRRAAGGHYYSFLGIPYGAAPTGDNRFKAAQPAAPWEGVLAADAPRLCVQPRGDGGQEDCLVLSVFAPPAAPAAAPPLAPPARAVLVYFHGGAFLFNTRPPTTEAVAPLLSHDIIVVTVNYRLGALGFLCLGSAAAPGNAGLRDQLLALRWVQDNIAAFGGDPARVTAVGTSAGGSSIQLLATSPAADGLFHRAVCMDGTALADKTLMTYPITSARTFAKLLGFESDDVEELTKFYKEVSVEKIVDQSNNFANLDNGASGFSPCVERPVPGVEPVVPRAPALALALNTRPMLFTYCDDEGSLRVKDLTKKDNTYNTDFPAYMPANLDFPCDEVKYKEANRTKTFYFGNKTISEETAVEFCNFWGDRSFVYQTVFSAREHVRLGGTAHLLEFTYVVGLSYPKSNQKVPGASHGDIFNYLIPAAAVEDEADRKVVDEMVSIVANFVKTGEARASVSWPAASARADWLSRLRVGAVVEPREEAMPEPLAFWDRLYRLFRRADYTSLVADTDH